MVVEANMAIYTLRYYILHTVPLCTMVAITNDYNFDSINSGNVKCIDPLCFHVLLLPFNISLLLCLYAQIQLIK